MLIFRSLFILCLALLQPAAALTLSGTARVVDGDTLVIGGEHVRLFGIDAPELAQTCERSGKAWPCGDWAKTTLEDRLKGRQIACRGNSRDRYGRLLATCDLAGADLGGALVRDGAAFAYRRYSTAYVAEERLAEAAGRGLWRGTAVAPETFRHAVPAPAQTGTGCAIKGNVSSSGRIFHLPGQRDYAATRIDPARGERWFCSPAEAEAAGWRAARR